MQPDGSAIRRSSVNKDGDYLPHCLDDGTIGYTRWEYQERNLTQIQSLWFVRPDGTWADALFKQHMNDPWALEDVRSIPGTPQRKFVAIAAGHHTLAAGPVVVINAAAGLNAPAGIRIVTPGVSPPEGGMSGTPVMEGGVHDDGGHYMTPWLLSEKYFLVAYSYLKTWPNGFPEYYRSLDEKGYALYLIDVFGNKELIQLLDEQFMELRRMRSFISFQPGEKRGCVGCHESKAVAPTPKPGLLALLHEPSIPAPPPWGVRPLNFLRDIQPIFDRHCVTCHGGLKPAAELDFSGGLTTGIRFKTLYGGELGLDGHNMAYRTLITKGLVAYSHKSDPPSALSQPLAFGSHRSKLITALREGSCGKRVTLSPEDWLRLVTWVDGNAPYHSHFINMRPDQPPYNLPADRELFGAIEGVHARRCGSCHPAQEVTRSDWIDLRRPERSLFLTAPLAKTREGRKCAQPPYADATDADYQAVLKLVDEAVKKAWSAPRRDLLGLLPEAAQTLPQAASTRLAQ